MKKMKLKCIYPLLEYIKEKVGNLVTVRAEELIINKLAVTNFLLR